MLPRLSKLTTNISSHVSELFYKRIPTTPSDVYGRSCHKLFYKMRVRSMLSVIFLTMLHPMRQA